MGVKGLKFIGAAALMTGMTLVHANAQAPKTTPAQSPAAEALPAAPKVTPGQFARGEVMGGGKPTSAAARAFVLGWNFRVCSASQTLISGVYHIIYAWNTDGSYFYYASPTENATQLQLLAACQHGTAGYYINVTNLATLTYNSLQIRYP